MTTLAKKGIHCLGTVRLNRVSGISFDDAKALQKKGRGAHQETYALIDGSEVRVVKWMDNRSVTLMSTYASAHPIGECKRYVKKEKATSMIPCPSVVKEYNLHMGGVDLMDSLISLYRIHTRSKKYYHKLVFHFADVALVNSWLLYRRDCKDLCVPSQKVMMLQEFEFSVAEALLLEGKSPQPRKGGRPSSDTTEERFTKKKKRIPSNKRYPR